jgi:hypothetical protein
MEVKYWRDTEWGKTEKWYWHNASIEAQSRCEVTEVRCTTVTDCGQTTNKFICDWMIKDE